MRLSLTSLSLPVALLLGAAALAAGPAVAGPARPPRPPRST